MFYSDIKSAVILTKSLRYVKTGQVKQDDADYSQSINFVNFTSQNLSLRRLPNKIVIIQQRYETHDYIYSVESGRRDKLLTPLLHKHLLTFK